MLIANPIYDTIFKFLLEDLEIARLILSTLMGTKVLEVEILPQERTHQISEFHLFRIDFKAKIKTDEGFKIIIIELQKANYKVEIERFRRYVGEQYKGNAFKKLIVSEPTFEYNSKGEKKEIYPFYPIFLLGKTNFSEQTVIYSERVHKDKFYNIIDEKIDIIEVLSHDMLVVQLSKINNVIEVEIDKLLQFFDQKRIPNDSKLVNKDHYINFPEDEIPIGYERVHRRLLQAISSPDVVEMMIVEDEITEQLEELYELKEIQKEVENQKRIIEEKEFELHQAELREKQAEILLLNSIQGMIKMGIELDQIAKILNIDLVQLKELLTKIK